MLEDPVGLTATILVSSRVFLLDDLVTKIVNSVDYANRKLCFIKDFVKFCLGRSLNKVL